MVAVGGAVALSSTVAPKPFLKFFGIPAGEATGAAVLGWRLMAVRMASISLLAANDNPTARALFLPVQIMDRATRWWGYRRGELALRALVAPFGREPAQRAEVRTPTAFVPGLARRNRRVQQPERAPRSGRPDHKLAPDPDPDPAARSVVRV